MLTTYSKITIAVLFLNLLFTQVSVEGEPKSLQINLTNEVPLITMPAVDKEALLLEDEIEMAKDVPYRFGTPFEVQYNLNNSGVWENLSDGRLWRLSIKSENAYSLNLLYDRFLIPEGAQLFVYDELMESVLGAFTHANNKPHETFSTAPTKGEVTTLEYYEPYNADFSGELQINRVVHAYRDVFFNDSRDYGDSGSCNNNVNCPEFADWADEVRSVAMILSSGGWRLCTGSLVNNVRQDLTPYFLTANHCLGGESSWIFMFNYESPGCSNQDGPTYQTVSGSTLLTSSSSSDFALLRLDETPPDTYEVHFAGWDASGSTPATPVGIHHPSGDIKKISFDYDNASNSGNYWDVDSWNDGTTEPGSSGSPLFDGNSHRIVGQLYGGVASCTNWGYDTYGKVSTSWNLGMKNYLDPDNTGISVLDGMDAIDLPDPELSYTGSDFSFELGSNESDSDSFTISNTGEVDSELNYTINSSPFENAGGGPDGGGYFWADSDNDGDVSYDWVDISGTNTAVNFAHNDESVGPFTIGFDFPFYGNSHSELHINPNGWIGFGVSGSEWENTEIPSSSVSGPAVFALWDDLNPENDNCNEYCSGNVYYHSNSDRMVIWFNEVAHWWTNFENSYYDFQIVLHSTGKIDLNYRSITGTYNASVGIQADSNTGSQVMFNSNDLADNLGMAFKGAPDWLTISPAQGTLMDGESQTVSVAANSNGLSDGSYDAYVRLVSSGGSVSFPVSLEVGGGGSDVVLGDLNMDGLINVQDIILMVNVALDVLEPSPEQFEAADLNEDGIINILDVIDLVNMILGGRNDNAERAELLDNGKSLRLEAEGYIGAVKISLHHSEDFTFNLTDDALVAEFNTVGNTTTLIIVAPESDELLNYSGDFEIIGVKAANASEFIPVTLPGKTKLSSVYPNPFNPVTTIGYRVSKPENVNLSIYNINGQLVETLVSAIQDRGEYNVTWDASHQSSGMYFLQLETGSEIQNRKLMLVK
ncbi:MAG: T9SS type A sorting domain-containing protein [Candidatus Marinimicrobia bacterium]|nr:T9SS type A sorting domain-containing protein [Candidatus Neomarinimicrobiota bacterium]